jgi:hypothetical protein
VLKISLIDRARLTGAFPCTVRCTNKFLASFRKVRDLFIRVVQLGVVQRVRFSSARPLIQWMLQF